MLWLDNNFVNYASLDDMSTQVPQSEMGEEIWNFAVYYIRLVW